MTRGRAPSPATYRELYAFYRERAESAPDAGTCLRQHFDQLCRGPGEYGLESRWWRFAQGEPRLIRCYGTECGFDIRHPETLYHGGYEHVAPLNTVSFASTGGGGCHFSFVLLAGRSVENCPVVMICPSGSFTRETGNVIVGDNLWTFLALGLRTGYGILEMLPLRLREFLAEYPARDPVPVAGDREQTELHALAEQFGLTGWKKTAIRPRLEQLRQQYFSQLVFGPNPYDVS